ncbi:MAG: putative dehydrogenase [Rhodothermales bacterium]|jgi:predicted dehydrogenase
MAEKLNRRQFAARSAWAGITILTAPNAISGTAANSKLRIACIGAGGRASVGVNAGVKEHIVAIAEVDQGQKKSAASIAKAKKHNPDLKLYTDYRELFDKHQDLDAVWVGCPDHNHFGAAVRGLSQGASVYCEKPLTWSIGEARKLRELAAEKGVATQMGNQGHSSDSIRRIVEYLQNGTLGKVDRVISQMGKAWGADTLGAQAEKPAGLDWNAWLGPAADMPFTTGLHTRSWRKYLPFGTGTLGDMACHTIDGAVWGLGLTEADRFDVEVETGTIGKDGHPLDAVFRWDFPATATRAAVSLWWYQGKAKPKLPEVATAISGMHTTYFGDKGIMVSSSHCTTSKLVPKEFQKAAGKPEEKLPRIEFGDHSGDFMRAARNPAAETACCSSFEYSGRLTEIILAGVAAAQIGEKLSYDMKSGIFVNNANANALLWRKPRAGWEFGYPA